MSIWEIRKLGGAQIVGLTPINGYAVQAYDIGSVQHREVIVPRSGGSGDLDLTSVAGGRVITLQVAVFGAPLQRQQRVAALRAHMDPTRGSGTELLWTSEWMLGVEPALGGRARFLGRLTAVTAPVRQGMSPVSVTLTFLCPSGLIEDSDTNSLVGAAISPNNKGDARALPSISIGGSLTDPVITNTTTGVSVTVIGGTPTGGIVIDCATQRIYRFFDGLPFTSINTATFGWPEMVFGLNNFTGPASLTVLWRSAWL